MSELQPKRLLITGASGFLGWNLCRFRPSGWAATGGFSRHTVEVPGVMMVQTDLTDRAALDELLRAVSPDAIVHAAALADPNRCQTDPELSRRTNVDASVALAAHCGERGIPLVFVSTDLVFAGDQAPYAESAEPRPVSLYGEHKIEAECRMREHCPRLTICRLPLMFGDPGPVARSFLQPLVANLRVGRPVRLFTDEFRTALSARDAAAGVYLALARQVPLVHVGGPERLSRFAFGLRVARLLCVPETLVEPALQADVPMAAPRPKDVSLNSSLARSLGFAPGTLDNELRAVLIG